MKKLIRFLCTALFLIPSFYCYSQVAHVFTIDDDIYTVTFSKNDNNYDFNISMSQSEETVNFTLPKLDITVFKKVIYQKLNELKGSDTFDSSNSESESKINETFYTVVANIDTIDDLNYSPIAGTLKIGEEINLYQDSNQKSKKLNGIKFQISNVQIVFQQGFIQDVIVDGKIVLDKSAPLDDLINLEEFVGAELKFTNYYGIGFSSKKNIGNLNRINLYTNQKKNTNLNFLYKKNKEWVNIYEKHEIHIKLGEVIDSYDFKNDLYTTDYSPANIKVAIEGGKSTTLYKDKTYKILEARVFSDFLGFNSENPNGLLQFEVEKQFNFNTTRYKFLTYRIRAGIGFMEYLKLSGGVTKIEDNNRYLIPEMQDEEVVNPAGNTVLVNNRFTTPVDVVNHQSWNVGISNNIILLDMPLIKSQLHINGAFKFAQTKVQDSLRTLNPDLTITSKSKEYNLNYWLFYPEVTWHVLPETRYGFYGTWRPKYFYSLTDGIQYKGPLDPLTDIRRDEISNWINEFELLGYLYVNEEKQNGKLFVRWRLNSEMGFSKNNFSQFQVGYSFFILGRGKQN